MSYLAIKYVHVGAVIVSFSLFFLRVPFPWGI